ncbi:MAG: 1-acyl-sn-glycerol-3-phosphate acyltransferase [Saprospiraceae bacterium]|nr:1-acyl-sn-glycerol-3-phosphate acyltransferase [Pyrinomonadaceae bacterium]
MKKIRASFRFVVFVVSTLGVYTFWWITRFFIPNKQFWRQYIFWRWARNFALISGMKVEVIGTAPKPPFFLVCNHLGYVDIPALRLVADGIFVAKSDIESWFLAGPIVRNMGMIFIDRKNRRDIPRAGAEIIDKLSRGEGVMLFPEGTSTKGEEILPFNSSFLEFAAKTDLPVSYAAISYRTSDGEPTASEMVCWWEDISFVDHLFRLFTLKEFTAIINFGEEPVQNPNRKELACELRERVEEKFIPVL